MTLTRNFFPLIACIPLLACGDSGGDSRGDSASTATSPTAGSISNATNLTATPTTGAEGDATATAGGTSSGGVSVSASAEDSGPVDTGSDPLPKFDTQKLPDVGAGCSGLMALNESYIWIPSTSDGWVSKINTRTLIEEARYLTGPNGGGEDISRTAVSIDGRFVVVNGRQSGRTTAVAANVADCKDTNGDGQITTSTSVNDIKPWGTDECVLWNLVHPAFDGGQTHGPRGVSWTPGIYHESDCTYTDQKIWLGYMGGNDAHLVRHDGLTGALEADLLVPSWDGSGYAPYGGALDPTLRPWFTGLRGELARVDTNVNPPTVTRISQPGQIQSYGMTVDPNGNPWMGGCSGPVSTYDVASNQWIEVAGTSACHRGMAVDHNFHVWVASNGPCGLVEVDGVTRTLVAQHQLAQCSTPIGVSVDVDGFVWLVDQEGWAWKIDPLNVPAMQMIPVSGSHYVYSDMTGGQLKSVSPPPA